MAKYRVRTGAQLLYPDGSVRGERGYVVDTRAAHDRGTLADQGDALQPTERSAVASPVNQAMFAVAPKAEKKATKKKASKKKASKK